MGRKPGDLPDSSRLRLVAITERSAPSPNRPRMDEDVEQRLLRIESESAACYADIEDATARFLAYARYLDNVPGVEEEDDGIPEEVESEESVVNHINELSMILRAGNGESGK